MKKTILFALIFIPAGFSGATSYNYLPNDVYIKQQEEKSALEYRIQQLENSMGGGSYNSASTIDSRISELQSEMQTEINYTTGLYASYGISNQLPAKIQDIQAKYQAQIAPLQSQRSSLQTQSKEDSQTKSEIKALQEQLANIEQLLNKNVQTENTPTVTPSQKPSAIAMFEYIDSLPLEDASRAYSDLRTGDPALYKEVSYLVNLKYPNGKAGSATNDEYLAKQTEATITSKPEPTPTKTYTQNESPVVAESEEQIKKSESTDSPQIKPAVENTNEIKPVSQPALTPEPVKQSSLFQKIVGFFKSFWF